MASVFSSKDYISVTTFLLILPEVDLNFIITVWMFHLMTTEYQGLLFQGVLFCAADAILIQALNDISHRKLISNSKI